MTTNQTISRTSSRTSSIFLGETWKLALQALQANKVRALLTMLGVVIGSGCIVMVVTIGLAGRRYIIGQIESVGANLVYATVVRAGVSRPITLDDQISPADLNAIKDSVPQINEVAGTNDVPMSVAVNGKEHPMNLVGVTEGFQQIRNLEILRGNYFGQDDLRSRRKICLITPDLASLLFPYQNPLGEDIRVGELHFTVIGVFRERGATFGQTEIQPRTAIVPFPLIKDFTGTEYFKTFYAQAIRSEEVPAVALQVRDILQSRHRPGARYLVSDLSGILETARNISTALSVVLILIAMIALLISGIGIMNIMLVTVTQRTHEIGVRKAIGAPRNAILCQFLMEAVLISGMGAMIGIVLAVSIPALINFLISFFPVAENVVVPTSWLSVVLAFLVSCSTGVLFGYLPARRASRLNPVESLRYE
jgi:putative ABC transport system permease protein